MNSHSLGARLGGLIALTFAVTAFFVGAQVFQNDARNVAATQTQVAIVALTPTETPTETATPTKTRKPTRTPMPTDTPTPKPTKTPFIALNGQLCGANCEWNMQCVASGAVLIEPWKSRGIAPVKPGTCEVAFYEWNDEPKPKATKTPRTEAKFVPPTKTPTPTVTPTPTGAEALLEGITLPSNWQQFAGGAVFFLLIAWYVISKFRGKRGHKKEESSGGSSGGSIARILIVVLIGIAIGGAWYLGLFNLVPDFVVSFLWPPSGKWFFVVVFGLPIWLTYRMVQSMRKASDFKEVPYGALLPAVIVTIVSNFVLFLPPAIGVYPWDVQTPWIWWMVGYELWAVVVTVAIYVFGPEIAAITTSYMKFNKKASQVDAGGVHATATLFAWLCWAAAALIGILLVFITFIA